MAESPRHQGNIIAQRSRGGKWCVCVSLHVSVCMHVAVKEKKKDGEGEIECVWAQAYVLCRATRVFIEGIVFLIIHHE